MLQYIVTKYKFILYHFHILQVFVALCEHYIFWLNYKCLLIFKLNFRSFVDLKPIMINFNYPKKKTKK